jgi:hypothetical protein
MTVVRSGRSDGSLQNVSDIGDDREIEQQSRGGINWFIREEQGRSGKKRAGKETGKGEEDVV